MKEIRMSEDNRTVIAKALNFNKYPVLTIDLADRDEYGLKGCEVRIDNGTFRSGEKYFINATLRVYNDEKYFSFSAHNVCIKKDFSYSDVERMIKMANTPIIKPDEDIAIIIIDSRLRAAYRLYIVHTDSRISPNCIDPMKIEKVDLSEFF